MQALLPEALIFHLAIWPLPSARLPVGQWLLLGLLRQVSLCVRQPVAALVRPGGRVGGLGSDPGLDPQKAQETAVQLRSLLYNFLRTALLADGELLHAD